VKWKLSQCTFALRLSCFSNVLCYLSHDACLTGPFLAGSISHVLSSSAVSKSWAHLPLNWKRSFKTTSQHFFCLGWIAFANRLCTVDLFCFCFQCNTRALVLGLKALWPVFTNFVQGATCSWKLVQVSCFKVSTCVLNSFSFCLQRYHLTNKTTDPAWFMDEL